LCSLADIKKEPPSAKVGGGFPFQFSTRRPRSCGALFPLYHTPSNLSREKLHKLSTNLNPGIVQFAQSEKTFKKPIDISSTM
jgi:hypothetical protein